MFLLYKLTGLLPARLRPYAKAVVPATATAIAVAVQWASTGTLDTGELKTAAEGAALALVAFLFPNVDA